MSGSKQSDHQFDSIEELVNDIRQGKMVILVDDEDRENEGDLVLAADFVTPSAINFMATEARGLVCLALTGEQIERLQLPQMVRDELNLSPNKTAFTVSIEASTGVSTGISAADRAHTIRVASNPLGKPSDVITPGHVFPIRAQAGGVLRRAGHTEGSVDLARIAGLTPAAVICEVMKEDGTMARVPDLFQFAKKHQLKIGTIVDLIEYRLQRENLVEEIFSADLNSPKIHSSLLSRGPTNSLSSLVKARVFRSKLNQSEHLVIQNGTIDPNEPVLVRVHLDSYSREFFHLLEDGESNAKMALQKILSTQSGVFVLLRGNNRPQGIVEEFESWIGLKPSPVMDNRDYGIGAQILRSLGVRKMILLSASSDRKSVMTSEKRVGLKAFDLEIVETLFIG